MTHPIPDAKSAGQESVWDYPRPAIAEAISSHITIIHRGITIADTHRSVRTLETSHPPSYYIPREDIDMARLTASAHSSFCEWKGEASYFDVTIAQDTFPAVAWTYPSPTATFLMLKRHIAFYAAPFDGCFVDGEKVVPQPGQFYGGWITSRQSGPFKGIPGSRFW
jgi:uncharacterized protein (DUF427 family)